MDKTEVINWHQYLNFYHRNPGQHRIKGYTDLKKNTTNGIERIFCTGNVMENYCTLKYLALLLLLFFTFDCLAVDALTAVMDLRESLEQDQKVKINGEWEFYWGKIIDPGNFENHSITSYSVIPQLWNLQPKNEKNYPAKGCATYRIKVVLDTLRPYAVVTPGVYSAYKFFVNGRLLSQNGEVAETAENYKPFWSLLTVPIERNILRDTNEFVLQVANFDHYKGGTQESIVLGNQAYLLNSMTILSILDAVLGGALIMGVFFFLGLFLCDDRQKGTLYFSLFCLFFSYYIISSNNYLLHGIVETIPWNISLRLEYISIYFSAMLVILFVREIYPNEVPNWARVFIVTVTLIYLVLSASVNTELFTYLNRFYLILLVFLLIFILWLYTAATAHKRPGALYSMIGTFALFGTLLLRTLNSVFGI